MSFFLLLLACKAHGQLNTLFKLLPAKETGVDFKNDINETEELNVLSYEYFYNGGGVAIGDINNDGLPDLYFTSNMKADKLYLNLGNMKFKDITRQAKLPGAIGWKTGVTMADVNADGLLDIYVCHSGNGSANERRNQLFINNGNLTFTEKAKAFGLDDSSYSTQAAFFDYDRDGDLDMYLVNHNIKDYKDVELPSLKLSYDSLAGDRLYKNDNGLFIDVTQAAGITGNPISFGLGIAIADVNKDGWQDIYISNDYRENDYLYINNGNGTFTDKVQESFQHISEFSMGNEIADINNDGLPDIITLDMLPEDNRRQKLLQGVENYELHKSLVANGFHHQLMRNMLQLNNGDGTFSEIGQLAGISNTDWSWSPLFVDFDNDGNKDLFVSNGYLRDYTNKDFLKFWGNYTVQKAIDKEKVLLMDLVKSMPSTLLKNYIFKNEGDAIFKNQTDEWGLSQLTISSGASYADLDNDGDLDLVINNVNQQAFIYENKSSENKSNTYLTLQLTGNAKNRFALGAKVDVFSNRQHQYFEQMPTRGYQSSVSEVLHIGLGKELKIDSLIVTWISGKRTKMLNIKSNQKIIINEMNGIDVPVGICNSIIKPFFSSETTGIDFVHKEKDYNDFKRQPLMPLMYSHNGPVLATGDVNNDGLADLFIGSSQNQPGKLVKQLANGTFEEIPNFTFTADKTFNATDATFFDADKDGDLDLYVVSGMYHDFTEGDKWLSDRLYFNDGNGVFSTKKYLPTTGSGKSCVRVCDYDSDGDEDLFIGGRVIPGKYPLAPASYLLQNDGAGNFTDVTTQACHALKNIGMVTDASWNDLNNDGIKDLILVGELMPVTILINNGKTLSNKTSDFIDSAYSGFWNTLNANDLDHDGDIDLIIGNLGLNTQFKCSENQPLEMVYKDFDNNGSIDPFLSFYIQGKSYPYVTRDELLDQIYPMRKKFTSYKSYADATLTDIFSTEELKDATLIAATTLETTLLENVNGKFAKKSLPIQAQYAPVYSIQILDVNHDNLKDIILLGNDDNPRLRLGKLDGNYGTLLLCDKQNQFTYVPPSQSGLCIKGNVKDSVVISGKTRDLLLLGVINNSISAYKIDKQ